MIPERVRNYINKHKLLRKGQRVLVTLSGGSDSTALLTLLSELGFRTSALYVNHNLRGQESLQEERFVRKFCGDRSIPLYVETIHWRKRPANLEEEARKRRYRHILKVAAEHKFSRVALAHHADDVAETLLLQLIRGSGPLGLQGLRPQRGIFVRPMLETSRQQILEYLNQTNTPYFTDTSNLDPSFRRNRVRLELIPYLEKHFHPQVKAALARAASLIHEQNKLVDQLLEPFERLLVSGENELRIRTTQMDRLPDALKKALLRKALRRQGMQHLPSAKSMDRLLQAIQSRKNLELPGFLMVQSTKGWIRLRVKEGTAGNFELDVPKAGTYFFPPGNVTLRFSPSKKLEFKREGGVAFIDAEKASFPLSIRNWKKGDFFQPLGLQGHKKLSDYWIDRKVPRNKRKMLPLVFKEDALVWVAGHQIDHQYRVTSQTRKILKIELHECTSTKSS